MSNKFKTIALLLVLFFVASLAVMQPTMATAPTIEWQQSYGDYRTESVSNVIQTIDGGYAFLDLGWTHGFTLQPAIFYKVDSLGKTQWQKTIDFFIGDSIAQTNDGGYEIAGEWNTYGTTDQHTPALLKTDSKGNIQWYENYTSIPNFNVNYSRIQTSDGGFASLQSNRYSNSILKTDSNGNLQWVENLTFSPPFYGTEPYGNYTSIIETKDGASAVIGVGTIAQSWEGYIYLTKTEAFLPTPSPTQLPTPMPTTITTTTEPVFAPQIAIAVLIIMVAGLGIGLLLIRRHGKMKAT